MPLPDHLLWLADAPLFIDPEQIDRFHDAVVQPDGEIVSQTQTLTQEQCSQINAKLNAEIGVEPGALASLLAPVFAFFKPVAKVAATGEGELTWRSGATSTRQSRPITTPQRLLVELTIHYLVNKTNRLFLVSDPSSDSWRTPKIISAVPRALAFLDLKPGTKFIPTAAEFADGTIQLLFGKLHGRDGSGTPGYPERPDQKNTLPELRKRYWQWFDDNFSATQAMSVVEEAASDHGRIRWIDYRLSLTSEGDTLHLHVCPAGAYDTGVFAYNLIKRGFKHGIRLIGTLKSEPDMNVLAMYEK
jgi:hypothetical protein